MVQQRATPSFSMERALHKRLAQALPRHGDRSKLVARLIEMWLNREVIVYNVLLKSNSVAQSNTTSNGASDARRKSNGTAFGTSVTE